MEHPFIAGGGTSVVSGEEGSRSVSSASVRKSIISLKGLRRNISKLSFVSIAGGGASVESGEDMRSISSASMRRSIISVGGLRRNISRLSFTSSMVGADENVEE